MPIDEDDLKNVQNVWEALAQDDPLWAILSVPAKKGRKWNLDEFFREGQAEVDQVLGRILSSDRDLARGTALDFGCGVGRLSQPLAHYFERVVGIDISPTMIELARQFNQRGPQVEYLQNTVDNLSLFGDRTFDFVYSNIVLQHMQPRYAIGYIKEFFRITKPGGFIVFQIPSHLTEDYLPSGQSETPLPETACRAGLRMVSGPTTLQAGERATLTIEVANVSGEDWIQRKTLQLNAGNHWLLTDGRNVVVNFVNDDGRSRLPGRLPAGGKVNVALSIKAPDKAGAYILEVDLVQEGVRWFKDAGSEPLFLPIRVQASSQGSLAAESPSRTGAAQPVTFMMEGVRKEEILSLIAEAGAYLVAAEEHVKEWYSYKYYVIR